MPETRSYNPEDQELSEAGKARRDFLRRTRDVLIGAGVTLLAGGIIEGCKDEDRPQLNGGRRVESLPEETAPRSPVEEMNQELQRFLNSDALRDELAQSVERDPELKTELSRILSSEQVIYYAVQYSASPNGLEKKFRRVLEDQEYRERVNGLIRKYCVEFKVPYSVAYGIAANESGFNFEAESTVGAKGIFQVMPETAAADNLQLEGADEIERNIYAGIKYLRLMYDRYGQWSMAMMAYSTGAGSFETKLREKARLDYREQFGRDQGHWREFLQDKEVNAVKLYSKKHYHLGGMHPFQYPFYIAAISELASRVISGEIKDGAMPDLMSPADFQDVCKKYPAVKERIRNKTTSARAKEIFRRLNVK